METKLYLRWQQILYFSSGEYTKHAQEIDTKLLDEINACFKEFNRLQETLSDLYRTQKASYND